MQTSESLRMSPSSPNSHRDNGRKHKKTMYELIEAGGWILLPIGLCSLIALAVFLERLWSLRRPRVLPNAFVHRIEALIKDKKHHDAQVLCSEYPLPAARIYATGLKHANLERSQLREPVEEAGRQEAQKLERHIELIGTCAAISPSSASSVPWSG